ncbi:MAG: PTS glucose transporter subunit IIA [Bacillota bacterium]
MNQDIPDTTEQPAVCLDAPISGKVHPLSKVPDPAFAAKLVGDGVAIELEEELVVAPVDGEVVALFPTGHAVALCTPGGFEVLVHIGVDTVKCTGLFQALVTKGARVRRGEPLIKVDVEALRKQAPSVLSPVVVTNLSRGVRLVVTGGAQVKAGVDRLLELYV